MTDENYYHSLAPGTELNEYRIERVLGMGSFGVTYLGLDLNLNKKVAIKEYLPNEYAVRAEGATVMPRSLKDEAEYQWGRERFLDEARVLAHFNHPVINLVHRYFEANNTAYIVLEYIEGDTLGARLDAGYSFSEKELLDMTFALCDGLALIHEDGYVHRDIKPQNIVLRRDNHPVLIDFGAARQAIESKTKAVTAILTPGYAPVEQYDQTTEAVGPWSDIYALGMVLYRCVSAPKQSKLVDSVRRILALSEGKPDPLPPLSDYEGAYSKAFLALIDHAIQVKEMDRPQTVQAWLDAYRQQQPDAAAVAAPEADHAPIDELVGEMDFSTPEQQAVAATKRPAASRPAESRAQEPRTVESQAAETRVVHTDRAGADGITTAPADSRPQATDPSLMERLRLYAGWVVKPLLVLLGAASVVLAYQYINPRSLPETAIGAEDNKRKDDTGKVGKNTIDDKNDKQAGDVRPGGDSKRPDVIVNSGKAGKNGRTDKHRTGRPAPVLTAAAVRALKLRGSVVYQIRCQSCHRFDGTGLPLLVPALRSSLDKPAMTPQRQIRAVLHGKRRNPYQRSDYDMPAFQSRLSNYDVAAVLTYINSVWGRRIRAISPQQVRALR